jgi:hypothetical protein
VIDASSSYAQVCCDSNTDSFSKLFGSMEIFLLLKVEVTRLGQSASGESTKLSLSAAHTASSTPVAASNSIGNMYDSNDIGAVAATTADTDAATTGAVAKETSVDSSVDAATADATASIGQPIEVIARTTAAIQYSIVTTVYN